MQNAALGVECLPMAVGVCRRIKAACKLVLGFRGDAVLSFEDYDIFVIQCIADELEIVVCISSFRSAKSTFKGLKLLTRRLPILGVLL